MPNEVPEICLYGVERTGFSALARLNGKFVHDTTGEGTAAHSTETSATVAALLSLMVAGLGADDPVNVYQPGGNSMASITARGLAGLQWDHMFLPALWGPAPVYSYDIADLLPDVGTAIEDTVPEGHDCPECGENRIDYLGFEDANDDVVACHTCGCLYDPNDQRVIRPRTPEAMVCPACLEADPVKLVFNHVADGAAVGRHVRCRSCNNEYTQWDTGCTL